MYEQLDLFTMGESSAEEHGLLMAGNGESGKNDNGVFRTRTKNISAGKLTGTFIDVELAVKGGFVYYEFGYNISNYGCFSPLDETSGRVERTLCKSIAVWTIGNAFRSRVDKDPNLGDLERKKLTSFFDKELSKKIESEI